ncbi:MAG: hypothetical protein VW397_02070 [Candidatus Margulisiibacteriota bacterium]
MHNKFIISLLVFIFVAVGLSIPIKLSIAFQAKETWIPKSEIIKSITPYSNIRLIQLAHWPILKSRLAKKYPMIEDLKLSFKRFPNIHVTVYEKQPWAMLIKNNQSSLYSYDGTLLNQNLSDFELPEDPILIFKTQLVSPTLTQLDAKTLEVWHDLSENLKKIPFLNLQHILLENNGIQLIKMNGVKINIGDDKKLSEKFTMLKYFLGSHRQAIDKVQFIDIQFPKRVIIK